MSEIVEQLRQLRAPFMRIMVCGEFTARHRCVEGFLHRHKWHVTAWFLPPLRVDATIYRAALDAMLSRWDGEDLPEGRDWNEDLVEELRTLCNCVQVRVWRQEDRLGAEWSA